MIDTGASISVINKELLDKTIYTGSNLSKPKFQMIRGVGGQKLSVHGTVKLPVKIRDKPFLYPLHVVENVHHSLILGQDFLQFFKAKIDLETKTLHLEDNNVGLVTKILDSNGLVRTLDAVTIPKMSETIISVSVSKHVNGEQVILEPKPSLTIKHLVAAKCVVTVNQ